MPETVNVKLNQVVEGKEGFNMSVNYEKTDLKTAVIVQLAQVRAFLRILEAQAKLLGVDEAYLEAL